MAEMCEEVDKWRKKWIIFINISADLCIFRAFSVHFSETPRPYRWLLACSSCCMERAPPRIECHARSP